MSARTASGETAPDSQVRVVSDDLYRRLFSLAATPRFRSAGGRVQSRTTWVYNTESAGIFWRIQSDRLQPRHDLRAVNDVEIFFYPNGNQMGRYVLQRTAGEPTLQVDNESQQSFSEQDLLAATGVRRARMLFDWFENHIPKASTRVEAVDVGLRQILSDHTMLNLHAISERHTFRGERADLAERRVHATLSLVALGASVALDTAVIVRHGSSPRLAEITYGLQDGSDIRHEVSNSTLQHFQSKGFEVIDATALSMQQMNGYPVNAYRTAA